MADATYTDLFGSEILLHYDASDAASLFTDTGGTSAASNVNEVKCIKPQADAALSVNLTNANGPIYNTNYNATGYPGLKFDGTNDALFAATTGLTASRFFVLLAFDRPSSSGTRVQWFRGNSASHYVQSFASSNALSFDQNGGSGGYSVVTPGGSIAGSHVIAYAIGASNQQVDGLTIAGATSGNVSASLTEEFVLGAQRIAGTLALFDTFSFRELLVIGGNCEWGQVIRGAKILRNKWGVPDPNGLPQKAGGTAPTTGFRNKGIRIP